MKLVGMAKHRQPRPATLTQLKPSRRMMLGGVAAVGVAAVAGRTALESRHEAEAAANPTARTYVSTDVTVPPLSVEKLGETAPGYLFLAPRGEGGKAGVVLDDTGEPVWVGATDQASITDVRLQHVDGQTVLTYWDGPSSDGHGRGDISVLDPQLRLRRTITGTGEDTIDLHETRISDRGTLLSISYTPARADLSSVGGPRDGWIYDTRIIERDIATNEALFSWSPLEHLGFDESYSTISEDRGTQDKPFDIFHANSVEERGETLLISMRHTHSLILIDRSSGEVLWRMGGKKSDFDVPEDLRFSWQHDARWVDGQTLSLFDNHAFRGSDPPLSRGMVLAVNEDAKTVSSRGIYRVDGITSNAQGSTQVLPGGNVVVGWGSVGRVHEFDEDGNPVLSVLLPDTTTYRAYRQEWTSRPATKPALAVRTESDSTRVYASWNGATEVAEWRVHSGPTATELSAGGRFPRTGFESSEAVDADTWYAVEALDADGRRLGMSDPKQAPAG